MINTLIYSFTTQYTKSLYPSLDYTKKVTGYINYYRQSILSALELNYDVEIYLSEDCVKHFKDLKIKIHTVPKFESELFDFIKAYILATRFDDYFLVDGDILFKNRITSTECDLSYEEKCYTGSSHSIPDLKKDKTWSVYYKPYVSFLSTNKEFREKIPEWTGKRLDYVHNIGIIFFKDKTLQRLYVNRWFELNNFLNQVNVDNKIKFTPIAAQYLLSEILNYHSDRFCSRELDKSAFTHNLGTTKFSKPKVSTSYIQSKINTPLI